MSKNKYNNYHRNPNTDKERLDVLDGTKVNEPVQNPEPIEEPVQNPEPIEEPVQNPEPIEEPVQNPEPTKDQDLDQELKRDNEMLTVVNTIALNVRTEPNTDSKILTTLDKGSKVVFVEEMNEDWFAIELKNGQRGYTMSAYLGHEQ